MLLQKRHFLERGAGGGVGGKACWLGNGRNKAEGREKVDFGAIFCELLFLQAMHELSKIDKKFCILFSDTRSILKISCWKKYGKQKPNKTLVKC